MSTATPSACDPARAAVNSEAQARLDAILAEMAARPGPLLEILHALQDALGHVPAEAVPRIAEALNLSRAEVHGVISFYDHFRASPAGRCVVQVCRAEACLAMNSDALAEAARLKLGIDFGETRVDGSATLAEVYCLGNCACAPSVMIDDRLHGRCTPRELAALIEAGLRR